MINPLSDGGFKVWLVAVVLARCLAFGGIHHFFWGHSFVGGAWPAPLPKRVKSEDCVIRVNLYIVAS